MGDAASSVSEPTVAEIAGMIDHALLKPGTTEAEIREGCELARSCGAASVCVMPYALRIVSELLAGSPVRPSTVIGFPQGVNASGVKRAEAERALADGGVELDMVVNPSLVLDGRWEGVREDILSVLEPTHAAGAKIKVIFETCRLQDEHVVRLCGLCAELGVDWVKTSTGFGSEGATEHFVSLMRSSSPPEVQVKASGGIRDLDRLLVFRSLGVTRVGASATASIVAAARERFEVSA